MDVDQKAQTCRHCLVNLDPTQIPQLSRYLITGHIPIVRFIMCCWLLSKVSSWKSIPNGPNLFFFFLWSYENRSWRNSCSQVGSIGDVMERVIIASLWSTRVVQWSLGATKIVAIYNWYSDGWQASPKTCAEPSRQIRGKGHSATHNDSLSPTQKKLR